jgi:hypothetical protein
MCSGGSTGLGGGGIQIGGSLGGGQLGGGSFLHAWDSGKRCLEQKVLPQRWHQ